MGVLGSLSHCMVESDAQSHAQARWSRGKSLLLSLAIEAAVVAALVVVPLLATGVLPPLLIFTPAVPYRGAPEPPAPDRGRLVQQLAQQAFVLHPEASRPRIRQTGVQYGAAPPSVDTGAGPAGSAPGVLDGEERGAIINLAPPRTASATHPLAQSEGVMAARLLHRVQPDYPYIAKVMRLQGTVQLQAIVGTDGSVQQLVVLSGNPILARAALDAVRQWLYQPTRLNGQPVEVQTNITVTFVLN
jgi:periplasmic protein TonB